MGTIFAQFGWCQIDYHFMFGEIEKRITDSRTDTVTTFVDNLACHADDIKTRETLSTIAFDRYKATIVAVGNSRIDF